MFNKIIKSTILVFIFNLLFINILYSEIIKEIKVNGNYRISQQTIEMFSGVSVNDDLNTSDINEVLKNLYKTNFFEDVSINLSKNILVINVKENPIIQNIVIAGLKAEKLKVKLLKI